MGQAGGVKRLPLSLFGLGIVLVVDLQGLLLYNIRQQGMSRFCSVVASLLGGRDSCIIPPRRWLEECLPSMPNGRSKWKDVHLVSQIG